jgi:hypothetical protein
MNTTELQNAPYSAPKHRNIWFYLAGLLLGLVLLFMMGLLFIVNTRGFGWSELIASYSILLIASIVLICIRHTRPFGLGFLSAEIVFLCVATSLIIWFLSSWHFYNVHF